MSTKLENDPHCPQCKTLVNGATAADFSDITPKPGDGTVCFYCAEILEFDEDLNLTHASDELMEAAGDLLRLTQKNVLRMLDKQAQAQKVKH